MGKVESFSIPGLYVFFNSSDHIPPHFHVKKKGEWEICVFIETTYHKKLDFNVKFSLKKGINKKEQNTLAKLVSNHKEKLLEEWENKVVIKEENK